MPRSTCRKRLRRRCPLRYSSMSSTTKGASCPWAGWMIQTVVNHHFPFCLAQLCTLTCITPYGGMAKQVNKHQIACLQTNYQNVSHVVLQGSHQWFEYFDQSGKSRNCEGRHLCYAQRAHHNLIDLCHTKPCCSYWRCSYNRLSKGFGCIARTF